MKKSVPCCFSAS